MVLRPRFGVPSFKWTDEAVARMTTLWSAGKSASFIATVLGCSRNAVIGKLHRLKLNRAPTECPEPAALAQLAQEAAAPEAACLAPSPPAAAPEPPNPIVARPAKDAVRSAVPPAAPVTIADLEPWHCHWIVSPVDGATTLYCGASPTAKSPYCTHHRDLGRGRGTIAERRALRALPRQSGNTGAYL